MCGYSNVMAYMWGSWGNFWESVLSFHHVGLGDPTQGFRLCWKSLYPLRHLTTHSPHNSLSWSIAVSNTEDSLGFRACEKSGDTRVYNWEFQHCREPWWDASMRTGSGVHTELSLISWRKRCDDPSQTAFTVLWEPILALTFQPPTV